MPKVNLTNEFLIAEGELDQNGRDPNADNEVIPEFQAPKAPNPPVALLQAVPRMFSFEKAPLPALNEIPEQQKQQFRKQYQYFLERVYKKADFQQGGRKWPEPKNKIAKVLQDTEEQMREITDKLTRVDGLYDSAEYKGLPDEKLLENHIFPAIAKVASSPETLEIAFQDALRCLEDLMTTKFYKGSSSRGVSYHFYQAFFTTNQPGALLHKAAGNFYDYYRSFGRKFALLAAAVQGNTEDEHYDGLSYSLSSYTFDGLFLGPLEKVPAKYHEDVLDIAIALARRSHYDQVSDYLHRVPEVIAAFEKEDQTLWRDYGDLTQHISIAYRESYAPNQKDRFECSLDFVMNGPQAVEAMKQLAEAGDYKPTIKGLAIHLLDHLDSQTDIINFRPNSSSRSLYDPSQDYTLTRPIHIGALPGLLEAEGLNPEEIERVLSVYKHFPGIGKSAYSLAKNYLNGSDKSHHNFISRITGYLKKLKGKLRPNDFIPDCFSYPWNHPAIDDYLYLGEQIAELFPRSAGWYFQAGEAPKWCDQIAQHGYQKYRDFVRVLAETVKPCEKSLEEGAFIRSFVTQMTRLIDDPRVGSLNAGIHMILAHSDDKGLRRDFFSTVQLTNVCDLLLCGAVDNWKDSGRFAYGSAGSTDKKANPLKIRDVDITQSALVLSRKTEWESKDFYAADNLFSLIGQGMDPRLTVRNSFIERNSFERSYNRGNENTLYEHHLLGYLAEIRDAEGLATTQTIIGKIQEARQAIKAVLQQGSPVHILGRSPRMSPVNDSNDPAEMLPPEDLRKQISRIDEILDHPLCKNSEHLKKIRAELDQALQLSVLRYVVTAPMRSLSNAPEKHQPESQSQLPQSSRLQPKQKPTLATRSSLLQSGGETTRLILSSAALLSSVGALHLEGMPALPPLAGSHKIQRLITEGPTSPTGIFLAEGPSALEEYHREIQDRMVNVLPRLEQLILQARKQAPGIMPEGGKIHTLGKLDPVLVQYIMELFGLHSTLFALQNTGSTLLLPVTPTDFELQMMVSVLALFGVLDSGTQIIK